MTHPPTTHALQNSNLQSASRKLVDPEYLAALEEIQKRVLWLSTLMIHHANHERPNPDGSKVGGHQASSASTVSILTVLYLYFLRAGDRVSIKPHASPAYHAVQYLLGQLPKAYLTTLRAYHGLQAYPSRTKDPDHVDFSTGSVGLGAVAPAFGALAHRYAQDHFELVSSKRFVALLGDAELDEGNVWEAILEESLSELDNLIWIVDLNRQSLDRVIPGIRAARLKRLFVENGWRVLEAKYGYEMERLFQRPNGASLRRRIDEMSNEEYQALIRLPGAELRARLTRSQVETNHALQAFLADIPDDVLPRLLANLGGHDLETLLDTFQQIEQGPAQPTILLAYTIKGWSLPFAGHPLNHSALLSAKEMEDLQERLGIAAGAEWERFETDSTAGELCEMASQRLYASPHSPAAGLSPNDIPTHIDSAPARETSTQEAFGRLLIRLADESKVSARIVTASPDVAVSTNLAGWINKTGVYATTNSPDFETEAYRLLKWKPGPRGQHVELGISEMNLFLWLGMFGLSSELTGQHLIPIGTVYDPFVLRGLDGLIYSLYSGAKFIFCGTPSGITLSPEGGAHQSLVTPSLGIEQPHLLAYEPCFAREVGWILLEALRQCCDRENGLSTYLRLSTKIVDQELFAPALDRLGEIELRRQVLAGGYCLMDHREAGLHFEPDMIVHIATSGAMVPEAVQAVKFLWHEGVAANLLNLVSARKLYTTWQNGRQKEIPQGSTRTPNPFPWMIRDDEARAPIITLLDGASHTLAWLGSVYGSPQTALGVDVFGQSGTRAELYHHYGISSLQIADAAFQALDNWRNR